MKNKTLFQAMLAGTGLLAFLAVFYPSFLSGRSYLWEDILYECYPGANYLATSLATGHFPLWVSGMRGGIPFYSDLAMSAMTPPLWGLALFVSDGVLPFVVYQWYLVLQLLMGGVFTLAYLRLLGLRYPSSFAGAVLFVFSANMSLHIVHPNLIQAIIWLPLECYFVKRIFSRPFVFGSCLGLVVSLLMSFLAGFPQVTLYNAYFVITYWGFLFWLQWREIPEASGKIIIKASLKEIVKISAVFLMVLLLGAVQLLPVAENWANSHRQQFGFQQISDLSLPWYYLIHGLVPNFFGVSSGDGSGIPFWGFNRDTIEFRNWHGGAWMYWDFGFYTGQLALIAVVVLAFNIRWLWRERREMVFFLGVLPIILLLMLGRYGGLFHLFYHVVPGFSMFRSPARIGCLFDFSAAILGAVLVDALWHGRAALKLRGALLVLGGMYGILFFSVMWGGESMFSELKDPRLMGFALSQVGLSVAIFAVTAFLLVWLKKFGGDPKLPAKPTHGYSKEGIKAKPSSSPPWRGQGGGACFGLVGPKGGQVWQAHMIVWALVGLTFLDLYLTFHKFHQGSVNPQEYYADRNGLIAQMKNLRDKEGPFRFAQLRDGKISEEVIFPRNIGYIHPGYEALEGYLLFNLKETSAFQAITSERVRLDIQNVGVIANLDSRTRQVGLMRYTNSLPRAKFYHVLRAYPDSKAIYADLDSGRLNYKDTVGILSADCSKYNVPTSVPPVTATAEVRFSPKTPEEYQISYRTTAPGVIFISESFYPGWEADGGKYPIIRAFGAFKGIVIAEAGSGVITVKFSPWTFKVGLAISLTTLVGLVLVYVIVWRRGKSVGSRQ